MKWRRRFNERPRKWIERGTIHLAFQLEDGTDGRIQGRGERNGRGGSGVENKRKATEELDFSFTGYTLLHWRARGVEWPGLAEKKTRFGTTKKGAKKIAKATSHDHHKKRGVGYEHEVSQGINPVSDILRKMLISRVLFKLEGKTEEAQRK
jgi:hypothetical protein